MGVRRDEFTAFYTRDKERCLRAVLASGVSPGQAEDALAEAFAKAWASWGKVRGLDSPSAWVVRVAINADISGWRKRRREWLSGEGTEPAEPRPGIESDAAASHDLVGFLRELPVRQREVVVLRYLLDLDTRSTATALGIATGTVTAHLHRALAALRSAMTEASSPQEERAQL